MPYLWVKSNVHFSLAKYSPYVLHPLSSTHSCLDCPFICFCYCHFVVQPPLKCLNIGQSSWFNPVFNIIPYQDKSKKLVVRDPTHNHSMDILMVVKKVWTTFLSVRGGLTCTASLLQHCEYSRKVSLFFLSVLRSPFLSGEISRLNLYCLTNSFAMSLLQWIFAISSCVQQNNVRPENV